MTTDDKATRILSAALQEFLATGFKDAKIDDIARRAGVGKGTVYQYFESKDKLFEAMIDDGMNKYVLLIEESIAASDEFQRTLEHVVRAHLQFITEHQPLAYLFYANDIHLSDSVKDAFLKHQQRIIAVLGMWMQQLSFTGTFKAGTDFRMVLSVLFGTLNQYYAPHIPGYEHVVSPEEFSHRIYQMLQVLIVDKERISS